MSCDVTVVHENFMLLLDADHASIYQVSSACCIGYSKLQQKVLALAVCVPIVSSGLQRFFFIISCSI